MLTADADRAAKRVVRNARSGKDRIARTDQCENRGRERMRAVDKAGADERGLGTEDLGIDLIKI